tara:strand:+ start:108276 stop:109502 length:1227 start_codon:yes stop_codon:yes gene_type:complete
MTVSSNQPSHVSDQSDWSTRTNHPAPAGRDQSAAGTAPGGRRPSDPRVDQPHSTEPLPPVLFALPNLRAEPNQTTSSAAMTTAHGPMASDSDTPPTPPPSPSSPEANYQSDATPVQAIIRHDSPVAHHPHIAMALPESNESATSGDAENTTPQPIADPADVAETNSRISLLDRIGSHAIVLVMLLIVFGIALLAGRKPTSDPSSTVADQSETNPNAVAATITDIPVSTGSPSSIATSAQASFSDATSSDKSNSGASANNPTFAANPPEPSTPVADANRSAGTANDASTNGTAASTVSVRTASAPTGDPATAPVTAKEQNPAITEATAAIASAGQTTVGPAAAAPATALESASSLDSAAAIETTNDVLGTASPTRHRYTNTPRKVADWSRYLPIDSTYVAPTSATTTQP